MSQYENQLLDELERWIQDMDPTKREYFGFLEEPTNPPGYDPHWYDETNDIDDLTLELGVDMEWACVEGPDGVIEIVDIDIEV